jgi:hypothetical protein
MDRVQPVKIESPGLGGTEEDVEYSPIEPQEDAIEAAGLYLQDASNRDETTLVYRDGDDLKFKDGNNPSVKTLTDLAASGSGVTEAAHKILRQLIHFIDEGPAEGFTSGAYREVTGTVFPTNVTWWESSSKTKKIVERNLTWTGVNLTTDQWKVYDTDGSTVLATVTDTISYSGVFETNRTRAIS